MSAHSFPLCGQIFICSSSRLGLFWNSRHYLAIEVYAVIGFFCCFSAIFEALLEYLYLLDQYMAVTL